MDAEFIVRFDDICPTMDWQVWEKLEPVLLDLGIKPIMAVVPSNLDEKLNVRPSAPDFWQRVRKWQALGWAIALHGFEHKYSSNDPGIIGVNNYSEFAGLNEADQASKLDAGLSILNAQGIAARIWVAPAHSFDPTTVRLLKERGVTTISDGYFYRPVRWHSIDWVPQQLWRFHRMPFGVWTVCYHINRLSDAHILKIISDLRSFSNQITSIDAALLKKTTKPATTMDHAFNLAWRKAVMTRRFFKRLL